jgi:hypothetical protein
VTYEGAIAVLSADGTLLGTPTPVPSAFDGLVLGSIEITLGGCQTFPTLAKVLVAAVATSLNAVVVEHAADEEEKVVEPAELGSPATPYFNTYQTNLNEQVYLTGAPDELVRSVTTDNVSLVRAVRDLLSLQEPWERKIQFDDNSKILGVRILKPDESIPAEFEPIRIYSDGAVVSPTDEPIVVIRRGNKVS